MRRPRLSRYTVAVTLAGVLAVVCAPTAVAHWIPTRPAPAAPQAHDPAQAQAAEEAPAATQAPVAARPNASVPVRDSHAAVQVTQADVADLVRRARAAGADTRPLETARTVVAARGGKTRLTTPATGSTGKAATAGTDRTQAAVADWQRDLLVFALRYGGDLLGKLVGAVDPATGAGIRKHSRAIADVIENADKIAKRFLVRSLVQLGIPAGYAGVVADLILALVTRA